MLPIPMRPPTLFDDAVGAPAPPLVRKRSRRMLGLLCSSATGWGWGCKRSRPGPYSTPPFGGPPIDSRACPNPLGEEGETPPVREANGTLNGDACVNGLSMKGMSATLLRPPLPPAPFGGGLHLTGQALAGSAFGSERKIPWQEELSLVGLFPARRNT